MHLGDGQFTSMCVVHALGAVATGVGIGLKLARKRGVTSRVHYATRGAAIALAGAFALSIGSAEIVEHLLLNGPAALHIPAAIVECAQHPITTLIIIVAVAGLWVWVWAESDELEKRGAHATAT